LFARQSTQAAGSVVRRAACFYASDFLFIVWVIFRWQAKNDPHKKIDTALPKAKGLDGRISKKCAVYARG
jgi:hypothetical protein